MDKVSVIIPVYNAEKYILRCLNSVATQTYDNLEILVIDDGSTDKSGILCDQMARNYNSINVIHSENFGVSHARNLGLDIATGKYVCFVDSDDWVEPDFVRVMVKGIQDTQADLVMCGWYKEGSIISVDDQQGNLTNVQMLEHLYCRKKDQAFALWNKIFKMKYVSRFDTELSYLEDGLFICDYLKRVKYAGFVNNPVYHYMINEGSITHDYHITPRRLSAIKASEKMLQEMSEFPSVYRLAKVQYQRMLRWILFTGYRCGDYQQLKPYIPLLKKYRIDLLKSRQLSVKMKLRYWGYGVIVQYNLGVRAAEKWESLRR